MRARVLRIALACLAVAPAPALAAEEGGAPVFWEAFNLLLLVAILVFLARRPVLGYLADRRTRIQEEIANSERLLREAEEKLSEWSERAERLDADVDEVRQLTRERASRESERILEEAQRVADRIRRDARAAVDREVERARQDLREEASDLAIQLAEQMLTQQVTDADRSRLVDEFVARIERTPRSA